MAKIIDLEIITEEQRYKKAIGYTPVPDFCDLRGDKLGLPFLTDGDAFFCEGCAEFMLKP